MYHSDFGRRLRSQSSSAPSPSSSRNRLDGNAIPSSSSERNLVESTRYPGSSSSGTSLYWGSPRKSQSTISFISDEKVFDNDASVRKSALYSLPIQDGPRNDTGGKTVKQRHSTIGQNSSGDRFIPVRESSDIQDAFSLLDAETRTPNRHKRKISVDTDAQKVEANQTFTTLLSSELFGTDSTAFAIASGMGNGQSSSSTSIHTSGGSSAARNSVKAGGSQPTTPTKKNLFSYRSPSSSRSQSAGNSGQSNGSDRIGVYPGVNVGISSGGGKATGGLFAGSTPNSNIADSLDSPSHPAYNLSPVKLESQRLLSSPRRVHRVLSKVPFKVLDAPELADDFYLNLVDWSSTNVLAVGLGACVYLWSAKTSNVVKLCDLGDTLDKITSISWSGRGNHLAVGTTKGLVQIWDTEAHRLLRTMRGHSMRVGSLAWNGHVLTSGSRDRSIFHRDVRIAQQTFRELKGHRQEVCGLKWNTAANQLASGGNDNNLFVWDGLGSTALHRFAEHTAAVKAIAWSPHQQGLLASGGGTVDMKIKFWNTITGTKVSEIDTGSQVCNLAWSKMSNEIISTHGFSGGRIQHQVQLWRYPGMQQIATLTGHSSRVLYLAMSPDGETIVSGAGDETLRFWDLNTPVKKMGSGSDRSSLNPFVKLR